MAAVAAVAPVAEGEGEGEGEREREKKVVVSMRTRSDQVIRIRPSIPVVPRVSSRPLTRRKGESRRLSWIQKHEVSSFLARNQQNLLRC